MKYKRMLCWVRPHEKKEPKETVNGRFPLVFAKNYEDFKNQITPDAYLIFSAILLLISTLLPFLSFSAQVPVQEKYHDLIEKSSFGKTQHVMF